MAKRGLKGNPLKFLPSASHFVPTKNEPKELRLQEETPMVC